MRWPRPPRPNCAACRFFEHQKQVYGGYQEGVCRRFPPAGPLSGPRGKYEPGCNNTFPLVVAGHYGDWCGEYRFNRSKLWRWLSLLTGDMDDESNR